MSAFSNSTDNNKANINMGSSKTSTNTTSISTANKSISNNDPIQNMGNNLAVNRNTHDPNDDIMAKLNELTMNKDTDRDKKQHLFWSDDPNIIFQKDHIFEFYPVDTMTYEQKLNAISRTVILVTTVTFILTHSVRILVIAAITMLSIFLMYYYV